MKLNPVLEKELRMFERSIKVSWVIFIYNIILAVVALVVFNEMLHSSRYTGSVEYNSMIHIYIIMAFIQFAMLILIIPGLTAGAISGEKERQTLDILLSTQMKPWQIVIGKLESCLCIVILLCTSSLPILSIVFVFGGIKMIDLLILIVLLVVEAIFIGTIGIFFSSIFKKTTTATVLTYATLLFVFLGSYLMVLACYMFAQSKNIGIADAVTDIHGMVYILLINPLVTFTGLISRQAGSVNEIVSICNNFGSYENDIIVKYWIVISMSIQVVLSIIFTIVAQAKINPLRVSKLVKKRKGNE